MGILGGTGEEPTVIFLLSLACLTTATIAPAQNSSLCGLSSHRPTSTPSPLNSLFTDIDTHTLPNPTTGLTTSADHGLKRDVTSTDLISSEKHETIAEAVLPVPGGNRLDEQLDIELCDFRALSKLARFLPAASSPAREGETAASMVLTAQDHRHRRCVRRPASPC